MGNRGMGLADWGFFEGPPSGGNVDRASVDRGPMYRRIVVEWWGGWVVGCRVR